MRESLRLQHRSGTDTNVCIDAAVNHVRLQMESFLIRGANTDAGAPTSL
jgi:hypothetical protein